MVDSNMYEIQFLTRHMALQSSLFLRAKQGSFYPAHNPLHTGISDMSLEIREKKQDTFCAFKTV